MLGRCTKWYKKKKSLWNWIRFSYSLVLIRYFWYSLVLIRYFLFVGSHSLILIRWFLFVISDIRWFLFVISDIRWFLFVISYSLVLIRWFSFVGSYSLFLIRWFSFVGSHSLVGSYSLYFFFLDFRTSFVWWNWEYRDWYYWLCSSWRWKSSKHSAQWPSWYGEDR